MYDLLYTVFISALIMLLLIQIWYDKTLALIREDVHVNIVTAPYYTADPLTIIDDFSTGKFSGLR